MFIKICALFGSEIANPECKIHQNRQKKIVLSLPSKQALWGCKNYFQKPFTLIKA